MKKENIQNTADKDANRKPSQIIQILIASLALGFLWVAGKGIIYIYHFIVSRL